MAIRAAQPCNGLENGLQIFPTRESAEVAAFLGKIPQLIVLAAFVHGEMGDIAAMKRDGAAVGYDHSQNHADRGGFSHAVAAHHGDHFAWADLQRKPEQHLAQAIAGLDGFDVKQGNGISHASSPHAVHQDRRA